MRVSAKVEDGYESTWVTGDVFDALGWAMDLSLIHIFGLLVGGGLLRFLVLHGVPRLSGKQISC